MNELQNIQANNEVVVQEMTIENRLEIIEEGIRKNYLARLEEMTIAPIRNLMPLEEDLIDNVRLYIVFKRSVQSYNQCPESRV